MARQGSLARHRSVRAAAVVVGFAAATATICAGAGSASADPVWAQHVYNTNGLGLWLHPDAAGLSSGTSDLMPDGTEFDVSCYVESDSVNGDDAWLYGTNASTGNAGYAADFYVDTDVSQGQEAAQLSAMGMPACGSAPSGDPTDTTGGSEQGSGPATSVAQPVAYDRASAAQWALDNYTAPQSFSGDDCTFFASQALWAGGLPQSALWTGKSWNWSLQASHHHYPGPTQDAAEANDLVNYLVDNGLATRTLIDWSDNTAGGAQPGDLIAYHWNNNEDTLDPDSGELNVDHLSVVVTTDSNGYPTIAQHTPGDKRYWSWDPGNPAAGHPAGWIQYDDTYDNGHQPEAWLIHINTGPTF